MLGSGLGLVRITSGVLPKLGSENLQYPIDCFELHLIVCCCNSGIEVKVFGSPKKEKE